MGETVGEIVGEDEVVLFVHAHPDDETITTGGTIALLRGSGVHIVVLTCTRGERGEVAPAELKHLEGDGAALAAHREGELADAMRILSVADHRFLGSPGARRPGLPPRRYTDSGMQWGPDGAEAVPDVSKQSLCAAPLDEVVGDIVQVISETGASSVVSYDETGGYGHPDHVRAHHASRLAAQAMDLPFFMVLPPALHGGIDTREEVLSIDVSPVLDHKIAALAAYPTQLTLGTGTLTHTGGQIEPIGTVENFQLLDEARAATGSAAGWQSARPSRSSLVMASILASLGGAVIAAVASVNHQLTTTLFGQSAWTGVSLALVIVAAYLAGLRLMYATRWVTWWAAVGIIVVTAILAMESPGGSIIIPNNPQGLLWAFGPAGIAAITLLWPRRWRNRRATMERDPSTG